MSESEAGPSLDDLLAEIRALFRQADIDDPALEARILTAGLLDLEASQLISRGRDALSVEQAHQLRAGAARRIAGEPVYRVLGWREFYGLRLALSAETLEPRPDTEAVVDAVLPLLREKAAAGLRPQVLDLGTGTGAICLALLSECPEAVGLGTDISEDALATAARNAAEHGLAGRFRAVKSDWFSALEGRFDIIVSNPPYIPSDDIPGLDREVREHDPLAALDGGPDGLAPYRVIANHAKDFMAYGGYVAVEFGWDQLEAVRGIFETTGFAAHRAIRDYGGRDRGMIFEIKPGNPGE
jgi:release factor glutamine methyltransferase